MSSEKKVRKFNIIDVIIILAVIAAIVVVVYKFAGKEIVQSAGAQDYYVTYTTYEIADVTASIMKPGDILTDNAGAIPLGVVIKDGVKIEDSHSYGCDSEGNYVMGPKEGYCCVSVTGKVNAVKADNGITVNGTKYLVGHSMTLEVGNAKMYTLITDITPVSAKK